MRESGGQGGRNVGDVHEHSLRPPYGYGAPEPIAGGLQHHNAAFYTDYQAAAYHAHNLDSSSAVLPTYTNFFNTSCVEQQQQQQQQHEMMKHEPITEYMSCAGGNQYSGETERYSSSLVPPVAIPMGHDVFSTTTASESIHRDHNMESLRRELAYKCPRSSDLLMAITRTADATVREHGSHTSGVSSDDDEVPDELVRQSSSPCNHHPVRRTLYMID